jgi:2-polyprenyl-3-methyl-5-hydroxy-6-metoxy-1,4-benzoquinol methylase
MAGFTKLTREKLFRNSKTYYIELAGKGVSKNLIKFCQQYAGKRILDYGCATGNYCSRVIRNRLREANKAKL